MKIIESEVGSNIAQNASKWSLIVTSNHILFHLSPKVDQNMKNVESKDRSNIAQSGLKCPLIVISSHFCSISAQKLTKSRKSPKVERDQTLLRNISQVSTNSCIKSYFGPFYPKGA